MQESPFFRVLAAEDKAEGLLAAVTALQQGRTDGPGLHLAAPESFQQVPGTPFAYWVSDAVRRKFVELPSFESNGRTVKQGLATADDFRFVRICWEVAASRILDGGNAWHQDVTGFQQWCQKRTFQEKRWVPFAKGGEYSPYYADIHLVVHWERDGEEMKAWADPLYGNSGWSRIIKNVDYYFKPGLTYPRRLHRLAVQPLPSGTIISVRGSGIYAPLHTLVDVAGLFGSSVFDFLVKISLGRFGHPQFDNGVLSAAPIPQEMFLSLESEIGNSALSAIEVQRNEDRVREISHAFSLPALLRMKGHALVERAYAWARHVADLQEALLQYQTEIDNIAFGLYGICEEDRNAIEVSLGGASSTNEDVLEDEDAEEMEGQASVKADPIELVQALVSYLVGCTFGRWDIRIALDPNLAPKLAGPFDPLPVCSPSMLVGPDGLPAGPDRIASEEWLRARLNVITHPPEESVKHPTITQDDYPLPVSWDGILVDDPDHQEDIERRVRQVFELLWGDRAPDIEGELLGLLDVATLRDYLNRPSNFFADHLKTYSKSRRKAPIYWPLSTRSGSYTLWVYYPRLASDTLFTAINRYVEPKLSDLQRRRYELETRLSGTSGREAARLREQIEVTRKLVEELTDLRVEIQRVTALPYQPNLNDGVIINAAPLHRIFRLSRWARDTRETWEKLERGDYDWAHLSYVLWPERVREKCRTDRSLAIAHDLESLYEPLPEPARGRRRRRASAQLEEGT